MHKIINITTFVYNYSTLNTMDKMTIHKAIGQNIKAIRTTNTELTQQQVANLLGCTQDMYSKIEIGFSGITNERLVKLCSILKCTPNNIYKDLY